MESRRDFFKKATLAGASMLAAPSLLADTLSDKKTTAKVRSTDGIESKLIVPKAQGLQITVHSWMKYLMISLIRIGGRKSGTKISNT